MTSTLFGPSGHGDHDNREPRLPDAVLTHRTEERLQEPVLVPRADNELVGLARQMDELFAGPRPH